jgi:hypothetical protein
LQSLGDLQARFSAALLDGREEDVVDMVAGDGISPSARLAIYRHHVFAALSAVLTEIYPVVCRLVDERFFAYAADRFIRSHPPRTPCLFEYGAEFPEFLTAFPPCRHLAYLPDVARLEWQMNAALHVTDPQALDPGRLGDVPPFEVDGLTFRFAPSLALLTSPWPIDAIWRANQPDADNDQAINLAMGPAYLEIRRVGDDVVFRAIEPAAHAFRSALVEGRCLGEATTAAMAEDARFDLAGALQTLFQDRVLIGFTSSRNANERKP